MRFGGVVATNKKERKKKGGWEGAEGENVGWGVVHKFQSRGEGIEKGLCVCVCGGGGVIPWDCTSTISQKVCVCRKEGEG